MARAEAILDFAWRVLLATLLLLGTSTVSFRLLSQFQQLPWPPVPIPQFLGWMALSSFLTAAVLAYPTVRSRWSGTQLMCAIFVAYFGVNTFINISQVLLADPEVMGPAYAAVLAAHGFLVGVLFSFVLVVLMGRLRRGPFVPESSRLHLPAWEWLWKLALCGGVNVGLFMLAHYVAWPSLDGQYSGDVLAPLWHQLVMQTGRALLLVAFVLPVVKMMEGGRLEAALTVAALFSLVGGVAPLILPSAFLPDGVRLDYMARGGAVNLAYGALVGWLLSRRPGRL
jgi:hypothetical protein